MTTSTQATPNNRERPGASLVAAGIFLSRVAGLIRERTFAHYFGNSDAGDAFKAALKIPNFLQNLLGEGVLSASLIPVYANLRAKGENAEADRMVRVVGTCLLFITSLLCACGIAAAPALIAFIAPGFQGEKAELTIHLVQIFFPGIGLLVMSAWCLGVLNSHRKFFLSYAAPVLWNLSIIGTLLYWGPRENQSQLALYTAWGLVAGSLFQLLVQLPTTASLLQHWRPQLDLKLRSVHVVFKNFVPVVFARGVVQLSAYIDSMLASLLPTGAVSALAYAQTLYLLPISLFGMSVSAAELPSMSEAQGKQEDIANYLSTRLVAGLEQIAFFVVPTIVAFLALGDLIVGAFFQTGAFDHQSTLSVWGVLAGATVGLMAGTQGRLYASAFYALRNTKTPLHCAIVRVILTTILGYLFAFPLIRKIGLDPHWGTAGLTSSAGLAAWVEFFLLRRALEKSIGSSRPRLTLLTKLWFASLVAAAAAFALKTQLPPLPHFILKSFLVLSTFGLSFLLLAYWLKVPHVQKIVSRISRSQRN